jgi:hypothetical protein
MIFHVCDTGIEFYDGFGEELVVPVESVVLELVVDGGYGPVLPVWVPACRDGYDRGGPDVPVADVQAELSVIMPRSAQ